MKKMIKGFKKATQSKFVEDVFTLQFGSTLTLGINFITSIFLARLLGASQYGTYALIYSLLGLVRLFTQLGFNRLTINQVALTSGSRDQENLSRFYAYFAKVGLPVYTLTALIGYGLLPELAELMLNKPEVGLLARPMMWLVFLGGFYTLGAATIEGFRQMRRLAVLENGAALLRAVLIITVLIYGGGLTGVIYASVIAYLGATLLSLWLLLRLPADCRSLLPKISEVLPLVKSVKVTDYLSQGIQIGFNIGFARFLTQIPLFLIGRFAPVEVAGYYQVANKILSVPQMVLASIGRSLLPKLSQLYGGEKLVALKNSFWRVTGLSTLISMVVTLVFVLLIPRLLLVYGQEYLLALPLVYWLAVSVSISGLNTGIMPLLVTLKKLTTVLYLRLLFSGLILPLGFFLAANYGGKGAAAYCSVNQVIVSLVSLAYAHYVLKNHMVSVETRF